MRRRRIGKLSLTPWFVIVNTSITLCSPNGDNGVTNDAWHRAINFMTQRRFPVWKEEERNVYERRGRKWNFSSVWKSIAETAVAYLTVNAIVLCNIWLFRYKDVLVISQSRSSHWMKQRETQSGPGAHDFCVPNEPRGSMKNPTNPLGRFVPKSFIIDSFSKHDVPCGRKRDLEEQRSKLGKTQWAKLDF